MVSLFGLCPSQKRRSETKKRSLLFKTGESGVAADLLRRNASVREKGNLAALEQTRRRAAAEDVSVSGRSSSRSTVAERAAMVSDRICLLSAALPLFSSYFFPFLFSARTSPLKNNEFALPPTK